MSLIRFLIIKLHGRIEISYSYIRYKIHCITFSINIKYYNWKIVTEYCQILIDLISGYCIDNYNFEIAIIPFYLSSLYYH